MPSVVRLLASEAIKGSALHCITPDPHWPTLGGSTRAPTRPRDLTESKDPPTAQGTTDADRTTDCSRTPRRRCPTHVGRTRETARQLARTAEVRSPSLHPRTP